MQKTVVIASLLKPVDDTRLFEKFALSIVSSSQYRVHILGMGSNHAFVHPRITCHPLDKFPRWSMKRVFSVWKIYQTIVKLEPDLLIVNGVENQLLAYVHKIIFGSEIYYDIQENYYRNILFTRSYHTWFRQLLASGIRLVERITVRSADYVFLAEECYAHELSFLPRNKFIVVENTYRPLLVSHQEVISNLLKEERFHLLFSGTVSEVSGIFRVIELVEQLYASDNRFHLTIVGYAAQTAVQRQVWQRVSTLPYVRLIGLDTLTPHADVIRYIIEADQGYLAYILTDGVRDRVPTKLFEYTYYKVKLITFGVGFWLKVGDMDTNR